VHQISAAGGMIASSLWQVGALSWQTPPMLDAIVIVDETGARRAEAAARTLATLVEGVVDGGLSRVLLVSAGPEEDLASLADAAGCLLACNVVPANAAATIAEHLSAEWLLMLRAGCLLPPGWAQVVASADHDAGTVFKPTGLRKRLAMTTRMKLGLPLPTDSGIIVRRSVAMISLTRLGHVAARGAKYLPLQSTSWTDA
jgi:hypothetical protein